LQLTGTAMYESHALPQKAIVRRGSTCIAFRRARRPEDVARATSTGFANNANHRTESIRAILLPRHGHEMFIQDDQGTPFPDASEAVTLVETMADELAQDEGQYHGHVIVVVDEQETG
jgi:hypothetical protein